MAACRCQMCEGELEPAQELRFLVEVQNLDNPSYLRYIRRLPAARDGRPMRVCKACQLRVEAARARPQPARTNVLAVCGLLAVGAAIYAVARAAD